MASKPDLGALLLGGPGHDGYTYNADVYCVDCGQAIIRVLYHNGKYDSGDNGDSNDFPQPIFFGESPDCTQHCGDCGEYLYGSEPEPTCILCGCEGADEECENCGNLSCNAHSESCEVCGESLCFECKARKHSNCEENAE